MKESARIRLQADELALEFDGEAGTVTAKRVDGAVVFGPLVCRAAFRSISGRAFDPVSSLVRGWKASEADIDTPLGKMPGLRAVLENAPGLPARLTWEIALIDGEEAVARLVLDNASEHAFKVAVLAPLAYRGADPGLDMGTGYGGWRFYRTGYQSWSPAGSIGVLERDYKPRFFLPSRSGTNPRTPYSSRPGEKVSDWMAQIVDPDLGCGALMGFVTSADLAGRVEFEVKYDRFRKLEAISDGEGITLDAGASLSSEWLLLSLSKDPLAQQARYYDLWGKAMNARIGPPTTGWCTWYFSFWKVSEGVVDRNLAGLEGFRGVLDYVQIDDGFEPWVGEWTRWNEKFPTPPENITARIRERGFKTGLWLAPFFVSRESPVYRQHPDWIIRSKRGLPVTAFVHPAWKGHLIYALDVTNPQVRAWLAKTVKTIVDDFGFDYLKLDFLYAAALPGVRHDHRATGAQALRKGLEIIREAAGEDTYILGCGCPLGPAIGIVDSMRVSQDVDIRWKLPLMDEISGIPTGPGAGNCLKNNLARALMHGSLWTNDPDCVVMRKARGGMADHEIMSELTVMYLGGGEVYLSEDVQGLPAEKLKWLRSMLPPSDETAVPLDLFERDFPETFFLARGDSALLGLFNWSNKSRRLVLDTERLGLEGSWHAFDFWAQNNLGAITGKKDLGKVPAHACKFLRLVRADGKTRLLGTDLHMGMGEVGFECEEVPDGLNVKVTLAGQRRGRIWVVFEKGKVAVRQLEFEDKWEGVISQTGE